MGLADKLTAAYLTDPTVGAAIARRLAHRKRKEETAAKWKRQQA